MKVKETILTVVIYLPSYNLLLFTEEEINHVLILEHICIVIFSCPSVLEVPCNAEIGVI